MSDYKIRQQSVDGRIEHVGIAVERGLPLDATAVDRLLSDL